MSKKVKVVSKRKLIKKGLYIAILTKLFLFTGSIYLEDFIGGADKLLGNFGEENPDEKTQDNVSNLIDELIDKDAIYFANLPGIDNEYYLEDKYLYFNEKIFNLEGLNRPVYLINCNIDDETLENIKLSDSKIEELALNHSIVDNNCLSYFPDTLKILGLSGCTFITDLSLLPERCPNIEVLYIDRMPSLTSLDFIYELPNLKKVSIIDSAYITEDFINYLNSKGIEHNLTEMDIRNNQRVNEIIDEIIKPNMTDLEKIQSVCLYVLDNVKYRSSKSYESNDKPLTCVLEDGKGVCASYAYLTNVLLSKAGIESYEVINDRHGWNMIKLDDNYYYIDTTNIDAIGFYKFILKNFNICGNYIFDVDSDDNSVVSTPGEGVVPASLMKDIYEGKSEEEIYNKYCFKYNGTLIIAAYVLHIVLVVLFPIITKSLIKNALELKDEAYEHLLK